MNTSVSPTWDPSTVDDYPCNDEEPAPEGTIPAWWIALIKDGLQWLFAADPNVFVAADLFWYAVPGKNPIRVAPDVMVVFGRPDGDRLSYLQWVEDGVPAQVVFEILSPGNRGLEMERKFRFYNRYGAEEYYLYNPQEAQLSGYIRGSSGLEPIAQMKGFRSPRLGITFHPWPGPENLVIKGPDGKRFLSHAEVREATADAERQIRFAQRMKRSILRAIRRTDEQTRLAEAERNRADEQTRLAQRLAAKLKELGVEPD